MTLVKEKNIPRKLERIGFDPTRSIEENSDTMNKVDNARMILKDSLKHLDVVNWKLEEILEGTSTDHEY
jgi:hypothetical protein